MYFCCGIEISMNALYVNKCKSIYVQKNKIKKHMLNIISK